MKSLEALKVGHLTEELYFDFRKMCRSIVRLRRFPASFSPSGRWEKDTYDELVDEWITLRFAELQLWAHQPQWFWFQAEQSLVRFIINQRRRTIGDALYRQVIRTLRSNKAFREGENGYWGLSEWTGDEPVYDGDEAALLRATTDASRSRPLTAGGKLRSEWVADTVKRILDALEQWTRAGDLKAVLLHILGISHGVLTAESPGTTPHEAGSDTEGTDTHALTLLVAEEIISHLSERDRRVVAVLASEARLTLAAVARGLGVSKPTARRYVTDLMIKVKQFTPTGVPLVRVLERLQERVLALSDGG